jgi:hypothetical protein
VNIIPVSYPPPKSVPNALVPASIKYLVIHHTAGPVDQMPLDIDREERQGEYAMMPYELLCTQGGLIYAGRPLEYESAATYGLNGVSVAVVGIGNFQSDDAGFSGLPTQALLDAIVDAGVYLHRQFPSIEHTIGHRDAGELAVPPYGTACPGDTLEEHIPWIRWNIYAALHP